MGWTLNSSRPALASELGGVLEEDLARHISARRVELARNIVAGVEPQEVTPLHLATERQMRAAIRAAVAIAAESHAGGTYLASLSGHVDGDDVSERVAVYVDRVR